jgi:S-adenosylhomocysteine hydrolase
MQQTLWGVARRGLFVEHGQILINFFPQLARGLKLTAPAMNIHDAVTCTMFNNYYAPKESIIDAIKVNKNG